MKKLSVVLIVLLTVFSACTNSENDFVSSLSKKISEHQSVHFKVTGKYYFAEGQDTIVTPYEVWVIRDKSDTLRNGYVWVNNNYRPYNMMYESGDFYLAIPPKKTSILYPNFTEEFISSADWIDVFLKPELFKAQITDTINKVSISDTIFKGEECKKISIQFPENDNEENTIITYFISKKLNAPLFSLMKRATKDYVYFDELYFSDYRYDAVDKQKLKEKQKLVLAENPVEGNGDNSEVSRMEKMLHIGDDAPLFKGNYYSTGSDFDLSEFIGKNVIIVDFWYTHCPPCVRAMPALSELNDKYSEKGLKIFGLNSVDNQPNSLPGLKKFLEKRQISYDLIMIQPEVDMMYKVNGYPTIYVVDKEGKIAYAEIGYDPDKFEKLIEKVEGLLGE